MFIPITSTTDNGSLPQSTAGMDSSISSASDTIAGIILMFGLLVFYALCLIDRWIQLKKSQNERLAVNARSYGTIRIGRPSPSRPPSYVSPKRSIRSISSSAASIAPKNGSIHSNASPKNSSSDLLQVPVIGLRP